jgi:DNA-binding MurR/RpiR family transcriptional regulator
MSAVATVAALAERAGVSTATVLRLIARLGFASYGDFQGAVREDLARLLQLQARRYPAAASLAPSQATGGSAGFVEAYHAAVEANLAAARSGLIASDVERAVALLAEPRHTILCMGGRYSGRIAELAGDYLGLIRPRVRALAGQSEGWARFLLDVDARTVLLVFDIRRYQASVVSFAREAKARGAKLILVTDVWHADLPFAADLGFALPTATPSVMDSLVAQLAFAEALVGALALRLGAKARERLESADATAASARSQPDRFGSDGAAARRYRHPPPAHEARPADQAMDKESL